MKRTILLLCFLIVNVLSAQWEWKNPTPHGFDFYDVAILPGETIIAVGEKGLLQMSSDYGNSWEISHIQTAADLKKIAFNQSGSTGLIIGNNGTLFRSNDNGNSWTVVNFDFNGSLTGIDFVGEDIVWLVTYDGYCYKSEDGGLNFTAVQLPETTSLLSVSFLNSERGIIGGVSGKMFLTSDGGGEWEYKRLENNDSFIDAKYIDEQRIALLGKTNYFKSYSGGDSWSSNTISQPRYYTFNSFEFRSNELCVAVGLGTIKRLADGGIVNWETVFSSNSVVFYSVAAFGDSDFIAVGSGGAVLISSDNAQTWTSTAQNVFTENDLNIVDFFFPDNYTGYAYASSGQTAKTTDGGETWEILNSYSNSRVKKVIMDKAGVGFAITGQYGGEFKLTFDFGRNWSDKYIDEYRIFSGCIVNQNKWFVVGESRSWTGNGFSGALFKTEDGGDTWIKVDSTSSQGFRSITFVNEDVGYAAGNLGLILKTTDGGNSWSDISTPFGGSYEKIQFLSESTGYMLSYGGGIIKTTDGGMTWDAQYLGTSGIINFHFYDENFGFAVSDAGKIVRTTDGGDFWEDVSSAFSKNLNSVFILNENEILVGGYNGSILKTYSGGYVSVGEIDEIVPDNFALRQNYPNPFGKSSVSGKEITVIEFTLKSEANIVINIFDILGRKIATLLDDKRAPGTYKVNFNASSLSAGVYIYQMIAGKSSYSKKMLLLR